MRSGVLRLMCGLRRRIERISRHLHPRYEDSDLQERYDAEFRIRVRSGIKIAAMLHVSYDTFSIVVGRGDMPLIVWMYYRAFSIPVTLGIIVLWLLSSRQWVWRCYNILVSIIAVWLLLALTVTSKNVATLVHVPPTLAAYDEPYLLFICVAWLSCFVILFEPDIRHILAALHLQIVAWLGFYKMTGVSIDEAMFLRMIWIYYLCCMCILELARRQWQHRHHMLKMQVDLERHAEKDTAAMRAERDEALLRASLADQMAMQSLMGAVFDINGSLQWRTSSDLEEPRLCFASDRNLALDELLQQSTTEQPLDIVLGPAPVDAVEKDSWSRERERLWNYACREVVSSPAFDGEEALACSGPARKIAITGATAHSEPFDMELFLTPCCDGRVLFGIRSEAKERFCPARKVRMPLGPSHRSPPRHTAAVGQAYSSMKRHSADRTRSACSSQSRRSSRSSGSVQSRGTVDPLPLDSGEADGSITCWIDVLQEELPILKCTAEFLAVFGTVLSKDTSLRERLLDNDHFSAWLRACTKDFVESQTINVKTEPEQVAMWADRRQGTQIRGMCSLDFSQVFEDDTYSPDCVPVALVLHNCRIYRTSSRKKWRSRAAGPVAADEKTSIEVLVAKKNKIVTL